MDLAGINFSNCAIVACSIYSKVCNEFNTIVGTFFIENGQSANFAKLSTSLRATITALASRVNIFFIIIFDIC